MPTAAALRLEIERKLERRFPAALTPAQRTIHEVYETGIQAVDALLGGGLPVGAISELTGLASSGRTSLALALVSRRTAEGRACAWVDVSDSLDPESAAANGVQLRQLLWVRCGDSRTSAASVGASGRERPSGAKARDNSEAFTARLKSCPDTSCIPDDAMCADGHPSGAKAPDHFDAETARDPEGAPSCSVTKPCFGPLTQQAQNSCPRKTTLSQQNPLSRKSSADSVAPTGLIGSLGVDPRTSSWANFPDPSGSGFEERRFSFPLPDPKDPRRLRMASTLGYELPAQDIIGSRRQGTRPWWTRLEQGLRATDLLLQAGGFAAIVLDLGDTAPEQARRIPLATWFRYRQAAERTQCSLVVVGQRAYGQSAAEVVLECAAARADVAGGDSGGGTVLRGFAFAVRRGRERFAPVEIGTRKPVAATWEANAAWNAERTQASDSMNSSHVDRGSQVSESRPEAPNAVQDQTVLERESA